jgi:hypothetical protein
MDFVAPVRKIKTKMQYQVRICAKDNDRTEYAATIPSPVLPDLNGDKKADIIIPGADGAIHAFAGTADTFHDGFDMDGFPLAMGGPTNTAVIICDLDNDHVLDLVAASNDQYLTPGTWACRIPRTLPGLRTPEICGTPAAPGTVKQLTTDMQDWILTGR